MQQIGAKRHEPALSEMLLGHEAEQNHPVMIELDVKMDQEQLGEGRKYSCFHMLLVSPFRETRIVSMGERSSHAQSVAFQPTCAR